VKNPPRTALIYEQEHGLGMDRRKTHPGMVASIGERKVRPTEPVEKSYGSYARTPLVSAAMTVLVRGVAWR
jgi:hypothetical protein